MTNDGIKASTALFHGLSIAGGIFFWIRKGFRMQHIPKEEEKCYKYPSLLHSFAIILLLLFSISVLNFAARCIFGSSAKHLNKQVDLYYEPDIQTNWTKVCPLSYDASAVGHRIKWKASPCHKKTLVYWHIPWLRWLIWHRFYTSAYERKLKLLKEQERIAIIRATSTADMSRPNLSFEISGDKVESLEEQCVEEEIKIIDGTFKKKSNVVYTVLTAMVFASGVLACFEVLREKLGKKSADDGKEQQSRRCSLADFTINRHMRKETQERQAAFDEPKKVKPFLHQGSLDRAISKIDPAVTRRLPRQSSVPARLISEPSCSGQTLARKQSADTSEDECSPAMRRRSRHFIRRH